MSAQRWEVDLEKPKTIVREERATIRMVVSIVMPTTSASRRVGGDELVAGTFGDVEFVSDFEAVGKKVRKRKTLLHIISSVSLALISGTHRSEET